MENEYDLKLCTSASELREAYQLRIEVFHEEQKFSKDSEIDSYDPVSAHFLLLSKKDNEVVATVRLTPSPYPKLTLDVSGNQDRNLRTEGGIRSFPLGTVQSESVIENEFMQALKSQDRVDNDCDTSTRGVKLSRLAVRKNNRCNGLGAFTVKSAEHWLQKLLRTDNIKFRDGENLNEDCVHEKIQLVKIVVSSQMQVRNFYEKLSYVAQGEPYDEEGMLHVLCTKRIIIED